MDFERDSLLITDGTSIFIDQPTRQSVDLIGFRHVDAVTLVNRRLGNRCASLCYWIISINF